MHIRTYTTGGEAVEACKIAFSSSIEQYRNTPLLILCSGGSALSLLEQEYTGDSAKDITVSVLDERYDESSQNRNANSVFTSRLVKEMIDKGVTLYDPYTEGDIKTMASNFNTWLKDWMVVNPTGVILITQGIGQDAHTSGILPYPHDKEDFEKLFMGDDLVVGYRYSGDTQFPRRITTTATFLMKYVSASYCLVLGEEKRDALWKTQKSTESLAVAPSRILNEMKSTTIYTDVQ